MKKTYGNNLVVAFLGGTSILTLMLFGLSEGFKYLIIVQDGLAAILSFMATGIGVFLVILGFEKLLSNFFKYYIVSCLECNTEFHEAKALKTTIFKFGKIETTHRCPNCNTVL
jgi:hypothetical protein